MARSTRTMLGITAALIGIGLVVGLLLFGVAQLIVGMLTWLLSVLLP